MMTAHYEKRIGQLKSLRGKLTPKMRLLHLLTIMALFNLSLFASETKEAKFWKWFQSNDERLFAFEKDREKIFGELTKALNAVNPDLTFEFGPVRNGGHREFVISAGGIKAAFHSVEKLYAKSPKMERWTFVKFRPRRSPIGDLEYG